MNIIESTPVMTLIDLLIVACVVIAIRSIRRLGDSGSAYMVGPLGVVTGLSLIGGLYFFDLATMWVLPGWIGPERSMAWMMQLHKNWSWLILLTAAAALTFGVIQTARSFQRVEKRLEENNLFFQSVVQDQTEYIVRWRPDGTRTFVNDAYCRYRGAKAEDLLGVSFFHLIAEEDRDRVHQKLRELAPERPTWSETHRSVAPDGSLLWQEWTDRGFFDETGKLVEVQSVGRDISAQRRVELELVTSELQYKAMFRASANGLTVRRLADGELLEVNPAMAAIFGYTQEEFIKLDAKEYVHPDSIELYPLMLAAVERGEQFPFEAKGIHRDGRQLDLEGHFLPVDSGSERQVLGVTRDVTEKKRAEVRMQESERRFKALFEAAPDAILVTDPEGRVLDLNVAACRLHGRGRDSLVGDQVAELLAYGEDSTVLEEVRQVAEGETVHFNGAASGSEGASVPVGVRASRFDFRGEPALLYYVTDLTDESKLQEQLRQAQKMEAVGQLAGGVAHDFNNLLTAIMGYAELAAGDLPSDGEAAQDIGEIQKAAEQATRLTSQLLAFSRQQVLEPTVLDLNQVVNDMERLCHRTIGENIHLVSRLDPALGRMKADRGQLEQVILNLAINARDAMPTGGELIFETANEVLDEEHVAHDVWVRPGSYVALMVSDSGCGMSEEVRGRIFEPFFTTKQPDKGTGLGLSTVYGIVKQSGGFIWVYSEPDRGTTFRILMPRLEGSVNSSEPTPAPSAISTEKKTILLVDDSEAVRSVASRTLREQGHEVITARSAEEALWLSREHRNGFDLLLTDLVLPDQDGLDLARQILSERTQTRVVLMSGYSKRLGFKHEVNLPIDSFLQKPFVKQGLLEVVARVMNSAPASVANDETAVNGSQARKETT